MDIDADPGATRPGATEPISARRFHEAEGVEDWRVLGEGACTYFRTGSFAAGARLVAAIGGLAGLDDHHPDVDLRHGGVTVRLITITDDYYGLSGRDLELARRISALAREQGSPPTPRRSRPSRSRSTRSSAPRCCRSGGPCSATSIAATAPTRT